ncbi:MAG: ABC transporter transmembrane domain-containing protein [Chloroflexota bacterium]|nr:ABC transporter transmembrane domain-containing protein [Chloroflexota bacterium]
MASLIRFLFRNLKGYRFLIILIFIITFLDVLAIANTLVVIKDIFNALGTPVREPSFPFNDIFNFFNPIGSGQKHSAIATITFLIIMLVALGLLDAGLTYLQLFMTSQVAQNLSARLRKILFDQLQRLSLDWHGKQKKGDLVQRITGDIANVEKVVTDGLIDSFGSILTFVTAIYYMVITQWQLTLFNIVLLPALFVIIFSYQRGIKAAAKRASKAVGEVADVAAEDFGAITVLKAFSLEDREALRFNKYVGKSRQAGLDAGSLQAQFTPVVNVLVTIGTAFIIGTGAIAIATGKFPIINVTADPPVSIGALTLFLGFLKGLYQPMKDFSKLTTVATSASAGAERMQEVLDQAPEIIESTVPYGGPQRFRGEITFENVFFGYTPERLILKGINLHIAAGKKVALVGLSGGGKTTLIKLIPRFYEVNQGNVKIDGIDNRMIELAVLRRNVSQVLQESVLFEGTILENIKIGRPEASYDEIVAAAKQAHIHDTIMDLPDGYDTRVRERGKNFSGGQRQRLAIARAIVVNSPILILDEPTASLDVEAEVEVLRAIDTLVVGRTVLMISHRLSTLGNVDEIIVLKDGHIVEQGTYQELKQRNGVFAGLLKEQNRYNVDYKGNSIIASRSEIERLIQQQGQGQLAGPPQAPAPEAYPPVRSVPVGFNREPPFPKEMRNGNPQQPLKARVLIEVAGKTVGQRQLDKPLLTVGRLQGNDVRIPSERVSRLHAKIRWVHERGAWVIEDAESLNGLVIQGQRVDQHVLRRGDRIYFSPSAAILYEPM